MMVFLPLVLALAALAARFILGRDSAAGPAKAAPVPLYVARSVVRPLRLEPAGTTFGAMLGSC